MSTTASGNTPPANPPRKRRSSELIESIYEELRRVAAQKMAREAAGHTLSATALVHDAYVRIARDGSKSAMWENRGHFYIAAAEAMRRILIDRARRKKAIRHGGNAEHDPLDSVVVPAAPERSDELLALDEALEKLAARDKRKARIIELRYFVGLTSEEAAEVLGISKITADRDWTYARAWLFRELKEAKNGPRS